MKPTRPWLWAAIVPLLFVAVPVHAQVLFPARGGTGTGTLPSLGQVLVGQSNGSYAPQATSTLGFLTSFVGKTTSDLAEGSNLYYTLARAQAALLGGYSASFGNATATNATTTNLAVSGSFNFLGSIITNVATWFDGLFDARLGTKTTSDLSEGSNKYFTDARADARVGAATTTVRGMFSATSPISISSGNISLSTAGDWTGTLDGSDGADFLARANHTGTQLAATISDFASSARTLFSSSATGLTYTSGTGAFSLTSGYNIPLTASTTVWESKVSSQWDAVTGGINYAGGNVGIGTTNPNSKFEVKMVPTDGDQGITVTGGSSDDGAIRYNFRSTSVGGANSTQYGYYANIAGHSANWAFYAANGNSFLNGTLDLNGNSILNAGNLSIKAIPTSSYGNLELFDTDGAYYTHQGGIISFKGTTASPTTGNSTFAAIRGIKENQTYTDSLGALVFYTQGDPTFNTDLTTVTEKMRITSAGNVGIGTTTPGSLLTVNGTTTASCFSVDYGATCITGGGAGTVTSVAASVPAGLTISGSPITTSGTLAFDWDTGYGPVLTASSTNWNGFYDAPSTRISAGTALAWSGNTLNFVDPGFLTTESDPVFSASDAASITSTDIAHWGTAYGWGNHATAGYLTSIATTTVRGMFSASSPLAYNASTGNFTLSTAGDWGGTFDGQEGSYYLDRANQTGSQTASTVSDFSSTARGLLSSTATGLTYTSGTGVFSLTSGYVIPLSASTTEWAAKQPAGNYLTALTGDVTASGPGSAAATLATVNSNVGSFGSSTAIPNFTVNGKGLVTVAGTSAVVAPAGTLTGTTLASNVVSSSLTSVGTIGTGVWQGTAIADSYIASASTWNAKESALTFTYPLSRSTNTISLAFGTTTANAWSGLQSFTNVGTTTFAGGIQAVTGYFSGLAHFAGNVLGTGTWDLTGATVKTHTYPAFSYATSTAWTGTTTIPLGPAYVQETWTGVKCFTDAGTVNVSFYDGTNRMNLLNASTTVGTVGMNTNNTFTASEKRYVDVGTPASTPTKISCTVDKVVNQ